MGHQVKKGPDNIDRLNLSNNPNRIESIRFEKKVASRCDDAHDVG